jgi:hypothetical protein
MVAQAPSPLVGGNPNHPPCAKASSSAHIYMFNGIDLTTRTTTYDTPTKPDKEKVTNDTTSDQPFATVTLNIDHFILRNLLLTLFYALPRALFENQRLILVHMPPKTTTSLKIWIKHHVLCLLSKFYIIVQVNVEHSWPPSERSIPSHLIISHLTLIISSHDFLTSFLFRSMLLSISNTFITKYWMRELPPVSCRYLVRKG